VKDKHLNSMIQAKGIQSSITEIAAGPAEESVFVPRKENIVSPKVADADDLHF